MLRDRLCGQVRKARAAETLFAATCVLVACGEPSERLTVGAPGPAFALPALDGTTVSSAALTGKAVILNFWATWCQPCLKEIPELKELAADKRLKVVGVALDEGGRGAIAAFVKRHGIPYTVLLGDQETFERYRGFGIPHTVVLDPSFKVVSIHRGAITRETIQHDLAPILRD